MSQLSPRAAQVLAALVAEYIDTGEPVGSARLMHVAGLGVSSATIRNTLAELEDLGYLQQPHTSAGRIPTDRGYRFYVDQLLAAPRSVRSGAAVEAQLRRDAGTPALAEDVLAAVSQVLSRASRLVAFALPMSARRHPQRDRIRSAELDQGPRRRGGRRRAGVAQGDRRRRGDRRAGSASGVELSEYRVCRHAARAHPARGDGAAAPRAHAVRRAALARAEARAERVSRSCRRSRRCSSTAPLRCSTRPARTAASPSPLSARCCAWSRRKSGSSSC